MVSDQEEEGVGRPDPIKSHFYDYVRNEHRGGMNQEDKFLPKRFLAKLVIMEINVVRCKVCRGCLTTPCRPVAKVRCEACLR